MLRTSSLTSKGTQIEIKESNNLVQPTIVRLNNSPQVRAFFRDKRYQWIYYANSNDDGLS
jgi:hypothetical protein